MMDFFDSLLSPFIFIIKEIFLFWYSVTGNYGVSVILLSFAISLILLPVFILIERSKKRNDADKQRMKPLLEEIKRCYRGQERYYYIRTLHRQHGFNSLKSLVPVLSLLLQIPFFIAAYQFLEHYEPLADQGFLLIKDLSAPDGLLGSINLLPIIMTLVNLLTAYFYTRNGDTSERRQMLVVAGVFLLLLYNFPSGLVLYWTMNNVFSFFRLFITNPEVFRRSDWRTGPWQFITAELKTRFVPSILMISKTFTFYKKRIISILPQLKIVFAALLLMVLATQVFWAVQNSFDQFILRMVFTPVAGFLLTLLVAIGYISFLEMEQLATKITIKPGLHFTLLFMSIYFYFAAKFYFTGHSSSLTFFAVVFTAPLQIISLLYFIKSREVSSKGLFHLVSVLILLLHLFQFINLLALLNPEVLSFDLLNAQFNAGSSPWLAIIAAGVIISLISVPFCLKKRNYQFSPPPEYHRLLNLLSIIYIAGLVFFWNPMIVYASYPKNFEFPAIDFLTNNYISFFLVVVAGLLIYLFTPKQVKHFYIKLILSVAFIVFLYSSIIPFDAGTLQVNLLSKEQNLAKESFVYLLEALLLIGIFKGIHWTLKGNRIKYALAGLLFMNILLVGQSLYQAIKTGSFLTKEVVVSDQGDDEKNRISFSKNEENIVLFVIDGAQGWYMQDLVEEDSTLREVYSGFTYYPNTLAMANYTYASVPSIMCGYDYTIGKMNMDEEKTIIEKVTDATELFYKKVKERGFDFTSTILRYSRIDHSKFDSYIPSWHDSWSEMLGLESPEEMWYTRLWENALFSAVPLFLKPQIYNETKWVMKEKSNLNLSELQQYHFVRLLPEISTTNNQNPNFIYIHSLFTHNPWSIINENNQFIRDVTPYECQRSFTYTFAAWLKWMKENDIYDNTKIILVSDHGPSWWHYKGEITTKAPIVWTEDEKISLERFLHLNSLLMVKDLNSNDPMKDDWRLMNTADVSAIAFNENDPTKSDSTSRTLPAFYTTWHNDLKTRSKFEIKHEFEVTDYVYDLHNWKAADQ